MTNIAFTSLIILILSFPGYVFLSGYYSQEFTRQVFQRRWTDDMARAVLFSVPFHVVGILIIECLRRYGYIHHTLDAEIAFRVLAGEFSNTGTDYRHTFGQVIDLLYQNQLYLLGYYLLIILAAWGAGQLFRFLIWEFELDVRWPGIFGFRNSLIYTILGRGQIKGVRSSDTLVWVDALTDEPSEEEGKTRLYRGLVAGFTTDEKGSLQDLILTAARRSKFTKKEDGTREFSWRRIDPGDYFLIRYDGIKNLNFTYISDLESAQASAEQVLSSGTSAPASRSAPTP